MENQEKNANQSQEQTEKKVQGWKDVVITPDMPLTAIVQFLNVLNQRLCTIEDNLNIEMQNGEKLSITEIYKIQAEQAEQEKNKANKASKEENKEDKEQKGE